ncbi:peptidyl-prolyl cis-trans isomerase SurA [Tenacibaculum caenipelagi]|uniref:Peptidyl-prolyl cis-trans isomerase SurA n=2 Tax=Tenacibaculum caenipelagi TaxID=1325435 RepID=A0A4R6TLA5_9FLAO|nr:peptidyl-prolyl cis-trans isomerase SurA [Tenacibaculum caenipelagi]
MVSEFKQVYEKNLPIVEDKESKDIDNYLELFINYKLKVKEAYDLKLDTVKAYQQEFEGYKQQLIAPYLYDEETLNELVQQAYNRTRKEVKASHVLIRYPSNGIAVDTLFLLEKITRIRQRIVSGEDFDVVAREVSEDPSARVNGGNLGYFSAFAMLYPLEEAAYKTQLGEISEPFKTKFGVHILKVTGIRQSRGEFDVAHILVKNSTKSRLKIDSIYQKLQSGASFEEMAIKYSDDFGSAKVGGKLPRFGTGEMVEEFENSVRSLTKEGEYSKPFKTKYGWHIVKLLKNYPVASFEEMQDELRRKVKRSKRASISNQIVLKKLKEKYQIKEYPKALEIFTKNKREAVKENELNAVVLSINEKKFLQKDFLKYIKLKKQASIQRLFEEFKNIELVNYFKEQLANTDPVYKSTLQEYREGLLLFDLMQEKIWNKASQDTLGVKAYYRSNQVKYGKEFDKVRGKVMSDYQDELEKEWIKNLRKNNTVVVKERVLRKLKRTYNQ